MKDHESRIAEAALGRRVIERQPEKAEMPVARERDPALQVSCRIGDASCAGAHAATLRRSTASQVSRARDSLLRLQRQYGNRFLQRVLAVARQSAEGGDVAPAIERAIHSKRGGGQALAGGVRGQMESAFGADFGRVRVHSDSGSDALNRSLNARAFTTGSDIFFRQGAYSPGSSSGKELLAHELTHVVQQSGGTMHGKLTVGRPGDRYEQEADHMARHVVRREREGPPAAESAAPVRRQAEEEQEHEEEEEQDTVTPAESSLQRQAEEEEKEDTAVPLTEGGSLQRQAEEEEQTEAPRPCAQRKVAEPRDEGSRIRGHGEGDSQDRHRVHVHPDSARTLLRRWSFRGGTRPNPHWRRVPRSHIRRARRAMGLLARRAVGSRRCRNYFRNNCRRGTLRNLWRRLRVWERTRAPRQGHFLGARSGDNVAYETPYIYRMGRWAIAGTILHEMMHMCGLRATPAEELTAENAVERCRTYTPFIQSIMPNVGFRGMPVLIFGFGFGTAQGRHDRVLFNGVNAGPAIIWGYHHAVGSQIMISVPLTARRGPATVVVVNNKVRSQRYRRFTIL